MPHRWPALPSGTTRSPFRPTTPISNGAGSPSSALPGRSATAALPASLRLTPRDFASSSPSSPAISVSELARATVPRSRTRWRVSSTSASRAAPTTAPTKSVPPCPRSVPASSLASASEHSMRTRQMIAEATNPLLSAALAYARRGWPVLPLREQGKAPDGRLVPHGLNDATTDETQIREWWSQAPSANVGIRTGLGLDVVDLDSDSAARRARSPSERAARSLGGGAHRAGLAPVVRDERASLARRCARRHRRARPGRLRRRTTLPPSRRPELRARRSRER